MGFDKLKEFYAWLTDLTVDHGRSQATKCNFFYYGSLFWGFFYSLWRSEQWGDLKFFCKTSSRFLSWLLRHDGISLWGPPPYIHHNGVNSRKFWRSFGQLTIFLFLPRDRPMYSGGPHQEIPSCPSSQFRNRDEVLQTNFRSPQCSERHNE